MPIGTSTAELDLMLDDLGVTVTFGAISTKGLLRRSGDVVNEGGIAVVLTETQVKLRAALAATLVEDMPVTVDGTLHNITNKGEIGTDGLRAFTIVPVGT